MSHKRIYLVAEHDAEGKVSAEFLVRGVSQSQAVAHVVKGRFSAEVASPDELVRLLSSDHTVSDAGSE